MHFRSLFNLQYFKINVQNYFADYTQITYTTSKIQYSNTILYVCAFIIIKKLIGRNIEYTAKGYNFNIC